jgi:hypothetical protein
MNPPAPLGLLLAASAAAALAGACSNSSDIFGPPGSGANGGHGAATTTTTNATTTTSDTGGAAGSGGGPVGGEDCLNGLDDDGNGLTDCDDPACSGAGYSCVPAVPGAQQYLVPTAQACPSSTAATSLVSCEGCSCTPSVGTCSVAMISYTEPVCLTPYAYPYGCAYASPAGQRWYTATTTDDGTASCWAGDPFPTPSEQPSCALSEPGHCANGGACVPPPFQASQACVLLDAGMPCPASYSVARPISLAGSQCQCNCDTTEVACDVPEVGVDQTTTNCGNVTVQIPVAPSCTNIGVIHSVLIPDSVNANPTCQGSSLLDGAPPTHVLCCQP